MAFGSSLTAGVQTSADVTPQHVRPSIFPFHADQYPPTPIEEAAPTVSEAAKLQALENAASAPPDDVVLANRVLVEIVGNRFLSESSRVRAAQLILQRYDQTTEIASLRMAIEELKRNRQAEFEHA